VFRSGIYPCRIAHRRSRPRLHELSYGAFYLLIDLDELDTLHRRLKWFSVNSFNLFSHYDRDHGPGANRPLRPWIEARLADAGVALNGGRIEILCLPRILGYVFNPLSVYFCYDDEGAIRAILYEVNNTFEQRHTYVFAIEDDGRAVLRHECAKTFYVSPFIDVTGRYEFSVRRPGNRVSVHVRHADDDGPLLDAWVRGERTPLTDAGLVAIWLRYPLLTLKVILGIHWEALKLWLKGTGLKPRQQPPTGQVTTIDVVQARPVLHSLDRS